MADDIMAHQIAIKNKDAIFKRFDECLPYAMYVLDGR